MSDAGSVTRDEATIVVEVLDAHALRVGAAAAGDVAVTDDLAGTLTAVLDVDEDHAAAVTAAVLDGVADAVAAAFAPPIVGGTDVQVPDAPLYGGARRRPVRHRRSRRLAR